METAIGTQKKPSCPVRNTCPLKVICGGFSGIDDIDFSAFLPCFGIEASKELYSCSFNEVEKGKLLWTHLHSEQCVHIIQSGVFVSFGTNEQGREVPFALFGAGIVVGIAELYLPTEISDTYHVRSLLPGTVCTVSLEAIRQRLRYVSRSREQKLMVSALANQVASAFTQAKVVSRNSVYERILAVLLYLQDLVARGKSGRTILHLTHEEISSLVQSDRVSVTRALHKLKEDGYIELNYKSITITKKALLDCDKVTVSPTQYLLVGQEEEQIDPLLYYIRALAQGSLQPFTLA